MPFVRSTVLTASLAGALAVATSGASLASPAAPVPSAAPATTLAPLPADTAPTGGATLAPANSSSGVGAKALSGPQVGEAAPAFSLPTIDGKRVSLADYRGQTLVINVWATWCPPCRQEMPDLIRAAASLGKNGVAFLGVDSTEEAPIVRAYATAKGVPYRQAIDGDQSFATAYDIAYFPTTFVIGPDGVLRARYIDVISGSQLASFVAAAKVGTNGELVSPLQAKIDAALGDPSIVFSGDAAANVAAAKAANAAIARAEDMLEQSDAAKGNPTDLLRTRSEEATLRDRAIAALATSAASNDDKALLALLRGDAARDRERYADALAAYRDAAALAPTSSDAFTGIAFAAARLKQYDVEVDADTKLVALQPESADPLVDLGIAQGKAGTYDAAYRTFARAVAIAQKKRDAAPTDASALRKLAWVHLYFGRTYAKGNDAAHARAEFAQTLALSAKLPANDIRHDMYLEEAQEATVALDLTAPGATTVSLAPWTGSELPGSVPNTIKYRLVVAGASGKNVALHAADVPKGWVASFCTDKVCAPFRVSVDIPSSGVKVIEFQLVPPSASAKPARVRVIENDGAHSASAMT